jgi:thioredoxin-dependent peroxiredoxin
MSSVATNETLMLPLPLGSTAPDFSLPATGGKTVNLVDYKGKNLIIVFYPKDQTPGCTQQLCALRDDMAALNTLNTDVIASNPDSLDSHQRFADKQGYTFPILVDADKTMATAYQALKPEGGIQRTVYIIDAMGIVRYAAQGLPKNDVLIAAINAF